MDRVSCWGNFSVKFSLSSLIRVLKGFNQFSYYWPCRKYKALSNFTPKVINPHSLKQKTFFFKKIDKNLDKNEIKFLFVFRFPSITFSEQIWLIASFVTADLILVKLVFSTSIFYENLVRCSRSKLPTLIFFYFFTRKNYFYSIRQLSWWQFSDDNDKLWFLPMWSLIFKKIHIICKSITLLKLFSWKF